MPVAYSRDPVLLFGLPHLTGHARALQPVVYQNATLWNVCYHEIRVHWHTGEITCFIDADDVMNNVPIMQTCFFLPCEPCSQDVYVRETFAFFQRGESYVGVFYNAF